LGQKHTLLLNGFLHPSLSCQKVCERLFSRFGRLRAAVLNELQRTQEHAATINRSAKNRFLAFLRDWSRRSGGSKSVRLPIGYQDIADHLGIKIETLSRTITELERTGTLARTSSRRTLTLQKSLPAV
jgi:CRP-like cAMP-binding protein